MQDNHKKSIESGLKLIAKSSVIVLIGIFISKLSLYIFRVIIARHYGPEAYGLFSLAVMILTLFTLFSALGLAEGILRYAAVYRGKKEYDKIKYILKLSNGTLIISSVIAAIALFLSSEFISLKIFHDSNLIIFLKISSLIIPFYVFSNVYLSLIRAYEKISSYSFILNILQNVIKLGALVILVLFGLNTNSIMFSYFIGIFGMFLFSYYFCKYKLAEVFGKSILKKSERSQVKKELFSYSFPLIFYSVLFMIYGWIDSFAIGYFKGTYSVGIYNAAIPIAGLLCIVPDLFIQIFYPFVTREFSRKKFKLVKELSKQVAKWVFILDLPVFLIIFIFPGAVINLLFGSKFLVAENALRILSVGYFLGSLTPLLSSLISMTGRSRLILVNLVVTSILNLILNIILVPRYGITGAAISTVTAWTLLNLVLFIEVKRIIHFVPLRRKMLRIFIMSILLAALLVYIRSFFIINKFNLFLLGALFMLSYILSVILTRGFDRNDLMILKSLGRKLGLLKSAKTIE